MPVTLTAALPPGQDSYLGNMYLGTETYLRRSGTGHGFPAAGAAPPDKRQGLASCVGRAAHDDTGLRSPVPETGAGSASHAPTAPRFPVRAHHRPPGYDRIITPDRRFRFTLGLRGVTARSGRILAGSVSGGPGWRQAGHLFAELPQFPRDRTCSSEARSAVSARGGEVATAAIWAAAASVRPRSRPTITTVAPSLASAVAAALPIPDVALGPTQTVPFMPAC
jgi:hypothetical protein